ncbi:MAG: DUF333 domain-containing protein [bacterium]
MKSKCRWSKLSRYVVSLIALQLLIISALARQSHSIEPASFASTPLWGLVSITAAQNPLFSTNYDPAVAFSLSRANEYYGYGYSDNWSSKSYSSGLLSGWTSHPSASSDPVDLSGYAFGYYSNIGWIGHPFFKADMVSHTSGGHTHMPPLDGGKPGDPIGQPNPAAVFCTENGGDYEIRTAEDGSQYGVCIFGDGSECDEWAYFRGECQPSGSQEGVIGMDTYYCLENGGTIAIRTAEDGSQYRACVFNDGSECESWAYQRGECQPFSVH